MDGTNPHQGDPQAQSSSGQQEQGAGISTQLERKRSLKYDVSVETVSTKPDTKSIEIRPETISGQNQQPTARAKGKRSAQWRLPGRLTAGAVALLATLAFLLWRQMPSTKRLILATGASINQHKACRLPEIHISVE